MEEIDGPSLDKLKEEEDESFNYTADSPLFNESKKGGFGNKKINFKQGHANQNNFGSDVYSNSIFNQSNQNVKSSISSHDERKLRQAPINLRKHQ